MNDEKDEYILYLCDEIDCWGVCSFFRTLCTNTYIIIYYYYYYWSVVLSLCASLSLSVLYTCTLCMGYTCIAYIFSRLFLGFSLCRGREEERSTTKPHNKDNKIRRTRTHISDTQHSLYNVIG